MSYYPKTHVDDDGSNTAKKNAKPNKVAENPGGFFQPSSESNRPSQVKNNDLNAALNTLSNSSSTEQEKVAALQSISTIFVTQPTTLVQSDTNQTLAIMRSAVLSEPSSSSYLITVAGNTLVDIFNSQAPLSKQNLQDTFPLLLGMIGDPALSEESRTSLAHSLTTGLYVCQQPRILWKLTYDELSVYLNTTIPITQNSLLQKSFRSAVLEIEGALAAAHQTGFDSENFQRLSSSINNIASDISEPESVRVSAVFVVMSIFLSEMYKAPGYVENTLLMLKDILLEPMQTDYLIGVSASALYYGISPNRWTNNAMPTGQTLRAVIEANLTVLDAIGSSVQPNSTEVLLALIQACFDCSSLYSLLNTNDISQTLGHIAPFLNPGQWNDWTAQKTKDALGAINAIINQPHLTLSQSQMNIFLPQVKSLLNNPLASTELQTAAGGLIANCCFLAPEMFDLPEYRQMFNLDQSTATNMVSGSPDWKRATERFLADKDFQSIYLLAKHNPGQPIIKKLFETSNITYFGSYPLEIMEHQYYNSDHLTGKQVFFLATTKNRWEVSFGSFLEDEDYLSKFDVRIIEPGSDQKLADLTQSTANRLGIKTKTEDPNGPKIEFFVVGGHGSPESILLKPNRLHKTTGDPGYLDLTDKEILKQIEPYLSSNAQGFFVACSTAGSLPGYDLNIAELGAKYLKMKLWGAQQPSGLPTLIFEQTSGGRWRINDVSFGVPTTSYDYASVGNLPIASNSISGNGNQVDLSWQCSNAANTQGYEIERSADGIDFEKAGFVPSNNAGSYAFTDTQASAYYRIKQVNMDWVGTNGSKAYTFAFSPVYAPITTGVQPEKRTTEFRLDQNYPNPFNASTTISYSLPKQENVTLKIYDTLGREVRVLAENELQQAGEHKASFESLGLASGVYIYGIVAGKEKDRKKMVLLK